MREVKRAVVWAITGLLLCPRLTAAVNNRENPKSSSPNSEGRWTHEYCVIGAGPAGIQLGYYLETAGRDYVIFERATQPSSFFAKYPRHRKLISINKPNTGSRNAEFNMRHDWNSLLTHRNTDPSLRFPAFDRRYFPSADSLVRYMGNFTEAAGIRVQYRSTVTRVDRQTLEGGVQRFSVAVQRDGAAAAEEVTCGVVVVATGLHVPTSFAPNDPDGVLEYYDHAPVDPDNYTNQDVLIIGRGNAAMEFAQEIYGRTARTFLVARTRVKLSWETHYVGHTRGLNNEILDSYMLKSLDGAGYARDVSKMQFRRDRSTGRVLIYNHRNETASNLEPGWYEDIELTRMDRVIACAGWNFDGSIFSDSARPAMKSSRYPAITESFESVNVPGLYFAGTLMHSRDRPKSSGGFIHGFRYLVRALHRHLELKRHSVPWPATRVQTDTISMVRALSHRVAEMAGPYQMFGNLADVMLLPSSSDTERERSAIYLEEVPIDLIPSVLRSVKPSGPLRFISSNFEFARGFSGPGHDTFNPDLITGVNMSHPDGPGAENNFLRPVFRLHHIASPTARSWAAGAGVDAIRTGVEKLLGHGRGFQSIDDADALLALAEAEGVSAERVADAVCPDDPEKARTLCFETVSTSEHHQMENARFDFHNEYYHLHPLSFWVVKSLPWLKPFDYGVACSLSVEIEKRLQYNRDRASVLPVQLDVPPPPAEIEGSCTARGDCTGDAGHSGPVTRSVLPAMQSARSAGVAAEADTEVVRDCNGVRFHRGFVALLTADGFCDDGWATVNLSCAALDFDGGDCRLPDPYAAVKASVRSARAPGEYVPNTDTGTWAAMTSPEEPSELTRPIPMLSGGGSGVETAQVESYQSNGHVLIPKLFSDEELTPFRGALRMTLRTQWEHPVNDNPQYNGFRGAMDAFRRVPHGAHWNLTTSPRLAAAAAELLGVPSVTIYMDQTLYKQPGHSEVPWHVDIDNFPFTETSPCISAWVSMADVDAAHGAMTFLSRSHLNPTRAIVSAPRDGSSTNALPPNADPASDTLTVVPGDPSPIHAHFSDHIVDYAPLSVGDVTFHSCRTFHMSPPYTAEDGRPREGLVVVYVGNRPNAATARDSLPGGTHTLELKSIEQLRKVNLRNADFFKLPANQMSWARGVWLHPPPSPVNLTAGQSPTFGTLARGALLAESFESPPIRPADSGISG